MTNLEHAKEIVSWVMADIEYALNDAEARGRAAGLEEVVKMLSHAATCELSLAEMQTLGSHTRETHRYVREQLFEVINAIRKLSPLGGVSEK